MAQLATVEAVRKRGNLVDADEVNQRIALSLDAASLHLASILRTNFDRVTSKKDRYWVDSTEFPFTDNYIKLYQAQGFIDEEETYSVKIALNLGDFDDASEVDPTYLEIEHEKGTVLITGTTFTQPSSVPVFTTDRQFWQVTYTAGFLTSTTPLGKLYKGVPTWLAEAGTMAALTIYRELCKDGGECRALDPNLISPMQRFLEPYIRFYPSALKPLV